MSDNINIPAIHDDDLLKLLEKHGLINDDDSPPF